MTESKQTTEIEVVTLGQDTVQTTNARNLYAKLGIKKQFSHWIAAQILRADLVENTDYLTIAQKGYGGQFDSVEYHLTLDACEHIALMSNTPKGKETRKQYIAIRKQFLADQKIAFEAQEVRRIEADYKENLKHHPNYEMGTALKNAIRCQEYDSAAELDKILDTLDFAPAAHAQGVSVAAVRRQVKARIAATHLLDSLHMGQHEHEDPVRDVILWAQTLVREEDARAKMLAYQKERAKPKLTYQDLLAQDMATKHDKLIPARKRAVRKPK